MFNSLKQTWCSMAIFQCFKHVSDLWLLESWLVCDSNALFMFGPFSREMASLKAWKWARGFTRWTTNDWVVFTVLKGRKNLFLLWISEPVSFGNFVGEGDGAGRWLRWMVGLNVFGWKCRECGFFHWHNMSFFVSSSENGLFHPKRSCQHEKYGCWTNK